MNKVVQNHYSVGIEELVRTLLYWSISAGLCEFGSMKIFEDSHSGRLVAHRLDSVQSCELGTAEKTQLDFIILALVLIKISRPLIRDLTR